MKRPLMLILIVTLVLVLVLGRVPARASTPYAIRAGKILTMARSESPESPPFAIHQGILLIRDGKIEALGEKLPIPEGYVVIDASDRWVTPGIVEAHTHVATEGGFNDMVTPINPELRIAGSLNPEDINVEKAITGGVTTIHTMPGSGTNLAGFTVIAKLAGGSPDEMILREVGAMKIAQAYNPERRGGDLGQTRMGMSWVLRETLKRAKSYADAWAAYETGERSEPPQIQPAFEDMRAVFEGKVPVIVHTYEGWGVMQTIRMFNDENQLKVIATHTAGGGYWVGQDAGERDGVAINIGPRVVDMGWSADDDSRYHGMAAEYSRAGVRELSINTDAVGWGSRIAPQQELAFQASMSARLGLDHRTALEAITINSARALDIDDRVGSLEVGKDADVVIKRGSLLDPTTPVDMVLIDGKICFQRQGVELVVP